MNAFYSSPVGQKVLHELPAVMQEGNQAAMPIMSKYLGEWKNEHGARLRADWKRTAPRKARTNPQPKN